MAALTTNKRLEDLPAWHREAINTVNVLMLDAAIRSVWLGIVLVGAKERGKRDGSIPHGEFRNWCDAFLGGAISPAGISQAMAIGRSVMEKTGFELSDAQHDKMITRCGFIPKPIRGAIEGKTHQALLLEANSEDEELLSPEERAKRVALWHDKQKASFEDMVINAFLAGGCLQRLRDSFSDYKAPKCPPFERIVKERLHMPVSVVRAYRSIYNTLKEFLPPFDDMEFKLKPGPGQDPEIRRLFVAVQFEHIKAKDLEELFDLRTLV